MDKAVRIKRDKSGRCDIYVDGTYIFESSDEKEINHILLLLQELGVYHWVQEPPPDEPDYDVSDW